MGPIQLYNSGSLIGTHDSLEVTSVFEYSTSRDHHWTFILFPELKPFVKSDSGNNILALETEAQRGQDTELISGGNWF